MREEVFTALCKWTLKVLKDLESDNKIVRPAEVEVLPAITKVIFDYRPLLISSTKDL